MKKLLALTALVAASGAQAAVLYDNGPVVDGAGLSLLTAPATTFGFGAQTASGNAVADDFSIDSGVTWNVTNLNLYGYQTGATTFPFTTATWSVISGDVNAGTVIASGVANVTSGGGLGFRALSTTPGATNRIIWSIGVDVPDFSISTGSYFLRWSLTGVLASGPWQPPTSDASVGNAAQSLSNAAFTTLVETGSGLQVTLPFTVIGNVTAVPENGTLALMLAGGVALFGVARRRAAR